MARFFRRLRNALYPGQAEDELARETAAHLALLEDDYRRRGMTPEASRVAARRAFGGVEQMKDRHRDARSFAWLDDLRRDVAYAARTLRKTPGFALAAALTLGLGIGANTTIFSLTDALVLRWLPIPGAQQILQVTTPGFGVFPYPLVGPLTGQREIFSDAFGFSAAGFNVGPPGAVERTPGVWVTGGYFGTLGLQPIAGRLLTREDDRAGAPPAAVIADGYWGRAFARDRRVVGQAILIEGIPVTIVGVSPPGFTGVAVGQVADITLPIAILPQLLPEQASLLTIGNSWLRMLARPNPQVTAAQAQARLAVVWPQLVDASTPASRPNVRRRLLATRLEVGPGGTGWSFLRRRFQQPLLVLMAVVGLVLLIACANVANLLLVRAAAREREIAVRLAIGAGRGRIVRQLLTESVLLSLLGGAIAVAFASVGGRALVDLLSAGSADPIALDLTPNWRVLGFTSVVTIATSMLFGLVPALRGTASGLAPVLRRSPGMAGRSRSRLGPALVVLQVSLSMLLVTGAGLFVRTLHNLRHLDAGFRHEGVLLIDVDGRRAGYRGARLAGVYQELIDDLRRVAGVTSVSLSKNTPLNGSRWFERVVVDGRSAQGADESTDFNAVSPGYFETLRTAIVSGRDFTERDHASAPAVAIVDDAFARRYFPDGRSIGHHVSYAAAPLRQMEIVGIVQNTLSRGLREIAQPTVYVPYLQQEAGGATIELFAAGSLDDVAAASRNAVRLKLPQASVRVQTLTAQVEAALVQERLLALLAGSFGGLALLLAAIGLYGLLAYTVTRRVSEIGVRMALGAQRVEVLWLVVRQTMLLTLVGIVVGLAAAAALTRYVKGMLFGLSPLDPATLIAVSVMFGLVAVLASYVPARRATRIDPLTALRYE
jgi:predicted permease